MVLSDDKSLAKIRNLANIRSSINVYAASIASDLSVRYINLCSLNLHAAFIVPAINTASTQHHSHQRSTNAASIRMRHLTQHECCTNRINLLYATFIAALTLHPSHEPHQHYINRSTNAASIAAPTLHQSHLGPHLRLRLRLRLRTFLGTSNASSNAASSNKASNGVCRCKSVNRICVRKSLIFLALFNVITASIG